MKKITFIFAVILSLSRIYSFTDEEFKEATNETIIHLASEGDMETIKLMMYLNPDFNYQDKIGWTALLGAVKYGHTDVVKFLIKNNVDVNKGETEYGVTPLMQASERGYLEIVKLLVKNNAEINKKNTSGVTALMMAAGSGHSKVTKYLIEKGAGVNIRAYNGYTALKFAIVYEYYEVAELLTKYNAIE